MITPYPRKAAGNLLAESFSASRLSFWHSKHLSASKLFWRRKLKRPKLNFSFFFSLRPPNNKESCFNRQYCSSLGITSNLRPKRRLKDALKALATEKMET